MRRRPPRYTRADTLLPYTPLFRATRPVLRSATPPIDPGAPLEQPDDPAPGKRLPRKHPLAHCRLRSAPRRADAVPATRDAAVRSEEHTSELQSLMRISYAVFCLKKKTTKQTTKQATSNTTII